MKIGILSRNGLLYSTRRLVQAAKLRGHSVTLIDTTTVSLEMGQATALSQKYAHLNAIIPRIGTSITNYGIAVVRQFESLGIATTASSQGIHQSRDKVYSMQLMHRHGFPVPRTAVIHHPSAIPAAVRAVGGLPVIMKQSHGTQGQGVRLIHDLRTAVFALHDLQKNHQQVLVQEFIAEAQGKDLRIIIVGGRCVAAMQRSAPDDDFRANLHQGGTAVVAEPPRAIQELARKACNLHDLMIAGVDLVKSERGYLLLEVNSSPGLKGIEQSTGVNVAKAIIEHVETAVPSHRKQASKRKKKRA